LPGTLRPGLTRAQQSPSMNVPSGAQHPTSLFLTLRSYPSHRSPAGRTEELLLLTARAGRDLPSLTTKASLTHCPSPNRPDTRDRSQLRDDHGHYRVGAHLPQICAQNRAGGLAAASLAPGCQVQHFTGLPTVRIEYGAACPDPFGVFGAREWVSPAPAPPGLRSTCFTQY
jgi:hypothetical protein